MSEMEFKKQTSKGKKRERERDKPRNRLLSIENKLMVAGGGRGGG